MIGRFVGRIEEELDGTSSCGCEMRATRSSLRSERGAAPPRMPRPRQALRAHPRARGRLRALRLRHRGRSLRSAHSAEQRRPKTAVGIRAHSLVRSWAAPSPRRSWPRWTAISGIGKKTAERLIPSFATRSSGGRWVSVRPLPRRRPSPTRPVSSRVPWSTWGTARRKPTAPSLRWATASPRVRELGELLREALATFSK